MKRSRQNKNEGRGYKFDPSEVHEVTYTKANHHNVGDKDLVSLPLAIMFINDGKIVSTPEIDSAIEKYGMGDLIKSNRKK